MSDMAPGTSEPFGVLPDGEAVTAHAIGTGGCRLVILDCGARLQSVHIDGVAENLSLPTPDATALAGDFKTNGPVIGPVLNRIANAEAEIDGKTYRFEPNEGPTLTHSGDGSTTLAIWTVDTHGADTLRMSCRLPDGYGGFPGNREIVAVYTTQADGFTLEIEATTDAPTLMNVGHHPYWTLGGGPWVLGVGADTYLPTDERKIPTGEVRPVEGTAFDFRTLRDPGTDVDHNFCLQAGARISLSGPKASLTLETDAPGLQVFSGRPFGIALEPQMWPDAPHHVHFPSIRLDPGETFRQTSRYRFATT